VQHTNRFGFRGPDVRVEKPDSVIRVAFLGDSYTFGEGVHDADVFPEVVERILNGEHALVPGKTVQSLDFGVGGYNTEQSLFLLNHLVLSFSPDVVVLGYTLNDAEQALFYLGPDGRVRRRDREALVPEGVAERKPPAGLLYRSRLAQEFWKIWWNRRTTRATIGYYRALYREDAAGWKATQDALSGIIETCRQHGIKLIVADLPILYRLNGPSPFASEYEKVRTFVEPKLDTDGVWLDLLSAVRGYRGPELWVHPTDQHPNERAHRLFAVRIAEAIRTLVGEAATSSG
jgi:lysophospholipase L1-like esterase